MLYGVTEADQAHSTRRPVGGPLTENPEPQTPDPSAAATEPSPRIAKTVGDGNVKAAPEKTYAGSCTPGRVLWAFLPEAETTNFLRAQCVLGTQSELTLKNAHAAARLHANTVGAPVAVTSMPIEPAHAAHLVAVQQHPHFQEAVNGAPWTFQWVRARDLIAMQKFVDLDRGQGVVQAIKAGDVAGILETCLPAKHYPHPVAVIQNQDLSWTAMARGYDFRLIGTFQQHDPVTKRINIGYSLGFGAPFVHVVQFEGRHYLKNGYHRAHELLVRGVEFIPAIVQDARNWDDVGHRSGFFPAELIRGPNPPRVGHLLDDKLTLAVEFKPVAKLARIKVEELTVPADPYLEIPPPASATQAATPPAPAPAGYVDFKTIQHANAAYRLDDGTILKIKQDLIRLATQPDGNLQFKVGPLVLAIFPPRELCGAPGAAQFPPDVIQANIVNPALPKTTIEEQPAIYELPDGRRLTLQVTAANVAKTSLRDQDGEPYYLVNANTGIQLPPAPPAPEAKA